MNRIISIFKKEWLGKVAAYVKDPEKLRQLVEQAMEYVSEHGLDDLKDNVKLFCAYIKAVATGKYKDYSAKNLAIAVAAIIYLVSPIDVIPDFLPGGFIDDGMVIGFALKTLGGELARFKQNYYPVIA